MVTYNAKLTSRADNCHESATLSRGLVHWIVGAVVKKGIIMCTEILLIDRDIISMKQLKEYLGSKNFVFYEEESYDGEYCLCPVNIAATLNKFCIIHERDDFMDYCIPDIKSVRGKLFS